MDELRPLSDTDSRDPLARLLRHGSGLEVRYDVESGLARHQRLVAAGAATATTTAGLSRWGWGAIATAIVGAGWLAARAPTPPAVTAAPTPVVVAAAPRPVVVAPTPAPVSRPPVVAVPPEPTPSAVIALPDAAKPSAPRRVARRDVDAGAPSDASANPEPDDRIAREAAQIRQIRGDLAAGRAAAALRGCNAGDTDFADGVFALEREGLRALALFALGRRDEAERAATRYLDTHPQGPLVARIRAARDEAAARAD